MIAIDTSVILAIVLDEPEAPTFKAILRQEQILIGWPTLFETRIVLSVKGFSNPGQIVGGLARSPNLTAIAFDGKHYEAAEDAYERFGKGRHPAGLNMGDCFAYSVASIARVALLFKGHDFGKTDIQCHSASAMQD
jgi:ribonuclease VapC